MWADLKISMAFFVYYFTVIENLYFQSPNVFLKQPLAIFRIVTIFNLWNCDNLQSLELW